MVKKMSTLISAEELKQLQSATKMWQLQFFEPNQQLANHLRVAPAKVPRAVTQAAPHSTHQATSHTQADMPPPRVISETPHHPEEPIVTHTVLAKDLLELQEKAMAEAREEGWQQGHAEGLEIGRQEGFEHEKQHIQAKMLEVQGLMQSMTQFMTSLQQHIAESVVGLALHVAKKVVQSELNTHPSLIEPVVRACLDVLPDQSHHLVLQLNPNDLVLLQEHMAEELQQLHIKCVADANILAGGCVLTSNLGTIDALLQTRWNTVLGQLGKDWPLIDSQGLSQNDSALVDHAPLDFDGDEYDE